MSRSQKGLIVAALCILGLWGCAQGQPGIASGSADHGRGQAQRTSRLEADFRAVVAARDQLRQKLSAAQAVEADLRRQLAQAEETGRRARQEVEDRLAPLVRERDGLREQIGERTAERDALQGQFELFRTTIRELLGQAEAVLPSASHPVTSVEPPLPGQS